jgi:hypothetical protein
MASMKCFDILAFSINSDSIISKTAILAAQINDFRQRVVPNKP